MFQHRCVEKGQEASGSQLLSQPGQDSIRGKVEKNTKGVSDSEKQLSGYLTLCEAANAAGFFLRQTQGYLACASCSRGALEADGLSDHAGSSCCRGVLLG